MIRHLQRLSGVLAALLFMALLAVLGIQITARFLFDSPLAWTDEVAVILYIWIILWAAAMLVSLKEHVMFDLLINTMSEPLRLTAKRLVYLAMIGLCLWAIPASWDYIHFMRREPTPVLGLPFFWVYLPFLLLLISIIFRSLAGLIASFQGSKTPL